MSENRDKTISKSGISIRAVNIMILTAAIVLSVLLMISVFRTNNSYRLLQDVSEEYYNCRQDAVVLMEASDYLTEMAREFVVTGKKSAALNYVEEIQQTRRRDTALEDLGKYFGDSEAYEYLESALNESNRLAVTEYYAMRLYIEGSRDRPDDYPEVISSVELTKDDLSLSAEDKKSRAVELVFGDDYSTSKDSIREGVSNCLDRLIIEEIEIRQETIENSFLFNLHAQTVLIILLMISVIVTIILSFRLIIKPLLRCVEGIRNETPIVPTGSSEVRFLAGTYNEMFDQSRRDREQLSYEAEHDELTGLYNRGVFEKVRASYASDSDIAMIIVDIDYFKNINDKYGHSMGDNILRRVSAALKNAFRSEDFVCRVGGDEFTVIMVNTGSRLKELVEKKLISVSDYLKNPDDEMPSVTLSIGIAFGDRENPTDDIYRDADTALYHVKESGRDGLRFY